MDKHNNIFSSAEIVFPSFRNDPDKMSRWAVIACDQHTSEPEYWEKCREYIGTSPSAYDYILPEAYLGTEKDAEHAAEIAENMKNFAGLSTEIVSGMIYVERTLPDGTVRHGIVGKMDLEEYDYSVGSSSPIRATEGTVISRIPPRCKVRAEAEIELPHILVLIEDKNGIFKYLCENKKSLETAYDFDLMCGGGHIHGYEVTGDALAALSEKIAEYESTRDGVVYAMGDGNHSLAAAKAHWENVKRETGDMNHPARYALCEVTDLYDESLVFHPIYRVIKNCNTKDIIAKLSNAAKVEKLSGYPCDVNLSGKGQSAILIDGGDKYLCTFETPTNDLTVGTLQDFIDEYLKSEPTVECDYIHGEDTLEKLAAEEGSIGFLMDGMDKSELFSYVEKNGTLPRKTFSMGEADSKRFYLEARKITK